MSCDRAPSFLGAYVLGVLDAAERREADEHLAVCPACAAELAEFRGLTAQLDRVPAEEVSAEPVRPSPELFARVEADLRRQPYRENIRLASRSEMRMLCDELERHPERTEEILSRFKAELMSDARYRDQTAGEIRG